MSFQPSQPPIFKLPENAPFSANQREWLGGFFGALLSAQGAPAGEPPKKDGPALADNDDAPWHDPSIDLPDRMKLADGKPLAPRLMAAMAQQDCGQCGYTCSAYANALFLKEEERLNLCAPGGKDTLRMLKALAPELEGTETAVAAEAGAAASTVEAVPGRSREAPINARFLGRRRLNREGSEKETWHIDIDLTECGLDYVVGDSLGLIAKNPPMLADAVIGQLGARPEGMVRGKRLRDVLIEDVSLGMAPDALFELIGYVTGGDRRVKARALANGEDPDGDAAQLDVLATLHKFQGVKVDAEAFVEALHALQPRLYSISSSHNATPGKVSLTVDSVKYALNRRQRFGVASTFLGERVGVGASVPVYVQAAHGFGLPKTPETPIIMVGPGTGIAPFRAFLQDRQVTNAPGKNWLFFGHQRSDCDFFYKDELEAMQSSGFLTRLSLAWSRDGGEKFYVQDRMRQVGAELWKWFEDGAHFYICGDAKRMAKDVERALVDIATEHGKLGTEEAVAFVAKLKSSGRFQADVY